MGRCMCVGRALERGCCSLKVYFCLIRGAGQSKMKELWSQSSDKMECTIM